MRLNHFLNEARPPKIYFAHPRATYGGNRERKAIDLIKKKFPDYIVVNPNIPPIQGRVGTMGFDIFFKVIDTVDFVVFMSFDDGKAGNGTWRELQYTDRKGKKIYKVNPHTGTIVETDFKDVKYCTPEETFERIKKEDQHKWKMHEEFLEEYLYDNI